MSLSVSDTVNLFNFNHPSKYAVIFHWGFNLHTLTINDAEHLHVLTGDNSLYLPTYLYNVFFKSVACFYIILMVSSISKKRKSDLSIFFLYGIDFKSCLRKLL